MSVRRTARIGSRLQALTSHCLSIHGAAIVGRMITMCFIRNAAICDNAKCDLSECGDRAITRLICNAPSCHCLFVQV